MLWLQSRTGLNTLGICFSIVAVSVQRQASPVVNHDLATYCFFDVFCVINFYGFAPHSGGPAREAILPSRSKFYVPRTASPRQEC